MNDPSVTIEAQSGVSDDFLKRRIGQFDYYWDARTFSYKLRKSVKEKKMKEAKYAIVLRRHIDSRGQYRGTFIDIKSTGLCSVLLDINSGVEELELSRGEPQATEQVMYHSYPGLRKRLATEQAKEQRDELLISDIQAGIFYVEAYQGTLLKDVEKMLSQGEISWDTLWALFHPNTLVYSYHALTDQDTVLIARHSGYTRTQHKQYLVVSCDMIQDDGAGFGYAKQNFVIEEYKGTRPITSLPTFPLCHHSDEKSIFARAVELGRRFVHLAPNSYHEISGPAFYGKDPVVRSAPNSDDDIRGPGSQDSEQKIFVNGRAMITPFTYRHFQSTSTYNPHVHEVLKKDNLTDEQYAICTPIVLGFSFDRKIWGGFSMTGLRDVKWNDSAFDSLVLGEEQKTLIHALVHQHAQEEEKFDDIIEGKGKGLIGLFAGTPGCGKTLTAEAVAEVTHKPLYVLSAGELGTAPDVVEGKLKTALALAQLWDAVLLLDEAEVFLTQRTGTDVNRNALVSIFLRQLEYYKGILILTTNMPEQCDRAFESRIHFSVSYPELDFASRKIIWATFFKKSSIRIDDEQLCRLALYEINGRQIKNTFSSALNISRANGSAPHTILKDVDVVLRVLNDWQKATRARPVIDLSVDLF